MGKRLKVLYVDDEALLKMAFVETLKQQGFDARGALSGQEAITMVYEDVPDIIILDVMMKPMDGWETLLHIKEHEQARTVPIIMQTGKSLTIKDVLRYGDQIDDYLIKPVRLPDLIRSIDGVGARNAEINREKERALQNGGSPADVDEYGELLKRVQVEQRLIEILGRIYPIQRDGTIETDLEIPELHEFVHRFETHKARCEELKNKLFSGS
ncbi:response regulator receiver domain protein (CheY-like) [Methanospirillum hungatei JF-1]|uniref:Response regulator receiver domain protein (CheY-like) n=1 Tax=Methanospirillum hungatei JF-1 (strain ATCC 27890 / DSM 864 / NBRC 100397 / JF-1) TaxID=323259 RepID=Q2FRE0_METHJ|nr:response regulator [Methanospirillum hungatei]ABD41344.1 response regulator receiver domain protein (CheY-like) [Methanospirillum hungatei JF-1]